MVYRMTGAYKAPAPSFVPLSGKLERKHRGACSEMLATAWLLQQGYEVFRNVSPFGAIDLIACDPVSHEMVKVDVKTCTPSGEARQSLTYLFGKKDKRVKLLFVDPATNQCSWD